MLPKFYFYHASGHVYGNIQGKVFTKASWVIIKVEQPVITLRDLDAIHTLMVNKVMDSYPPQHFALKAQTQIHDVVVLSINQLGYMTDAEFEFVPPQEQAPVAPTPAHEVESPPSTVGEVVAAANDPTEQPSDSPAEGKL